MTIPVGLYQRFYVELTNNPDVIDERTDPLEYNINLINGGGFLRVQFTKVKKE